MPGAGAAGPNHGLGFGEVQSRAGQMHPDVIDSEQNHQDLFVETDAATDEGEGKAVMECGRKLVVDVFQCEKSRRFINNERLVQDLVQAGFHMMWMSFDHGCGLAETAYLLRDVKVLISLQGNALGASICLRDHGPMSTVISVDNSRWLEP